MPDAVHPGPAQSPAVAAALDARLNAQNQAPPLVDVNLF